MLMNYEKMFCFACFRMVGGRYFLATNFPTGRTCWGRHMMHVIYKSWACASNVYKRNYANVIALAKMGAIMMIMILLFFSFFSPSFDISFLLVHVVLAPFSTHPTPFSRILFSLWISWMRSLLLVCVLCNYYGQRFFPPFKLVIILKKKKNLYLQLYYLDFSQSVSREKRFICNYANL